MKEEVEYLPIGKVIYLPFAMIQVVKGDGCTGCVFEHSCACGVVQKMFGSCLRINRGDSDIIFKLIPHE